MIDQIQKDLETVHFDLTITDRARLDWIEKHVDRVLVTAAVDVTDAGEERRFRFSTRLTDGPEWTYSAASSSLREAIDAAITHEAAATADPR